MEMRSIRWSAAVRMDSVSCFGRCLGSAVSSFFESPHVLDEQEHRLIVDDIAARRRGEGRCATPPWTNISQALSELDVIDGRLSDVLKGGFRAL